MAQFFLDPSRESETHALPDGEAFHLNVGSAMFDSEGESREPGWYWWACFPGCLPDSEPHGPFDSEALAIEDAREGGGT